MEPGVPFDSKKNCINAVVIFYQKWKKWNLGTELYFRSRIPLHPAMQETQIDIYFNLALLNFANRVFGQWNFNFRS